MNIAGSVSVEASLSVDANVAAEAKAYFEGTGEKNTKHCWRIKQFNLVKVDPKEFGQFYEGDSYIFLASQERVHHCHFWIGCESTVDEYASAAMLTTNLSDFLSSNTGKGTVHHREEQNCESGLFLSYFSHGVQYLKGGYESGVKKVQPETFEPRLLQIKGKRPVRAYEVDMTANSVNDGDVFIADTGLKIYYWMGSKANPRERIESMKIGERLKSERSGCELIITSDSKAEEDAFWALLGGRPASINPPVADDVAQGLSGIKFFKLSNDGGNFGVQEITERPLRADMLKDDDCFLLELPRELYWWTGKNSDAYEKKAAREYVNQMNKEKRKSLTRVFGGVEDSIFKSNFVGFDIPKQIDFSKPKEERKKEQIDFQAIAEQKIKEHVPLFKGSDITTLIGYQVLEQGGEMMEIKKEELGYFFEEECYIFDIVLEKLREHFIIFWIGKESTNVKRTQTAYNAVQLDNNAKIDATQIRIFQGDEIEELTGLFPRGFVLIEGAARQSEDIKAGKILFQVKTRFTLNPKAAQVPVDASSLNSGDSFCLYNEGTAYIWLGQGSNEGERKFVRSLAEGMKTVEMEEGSETEEFWDLLGGKKDYDHVISSELSQFEPRLFQLSDATGNMRLEEIYNFSQNDLFEEEIYLLDARSTIYVWIGGHSSVEEKKVALDCAKKFLEAQVDGRSKGAPIIQVIQSKEPAAFKSLFFDWDDNYVANAFEEYTKGMGESKQQEVKEAAKETEALMGRIQGAGSEFLNPQENKFKYEELFKKFPKGVNPVCKEEYLTDVEFEVVFKMKRPQFLALKEWKQVDKKKEVGLF